MTGLTFVRVVTLALLLAAVVALVVACAANHENLCGHVCQPFVGDEDRWLECVRACSVWR